MRVTDNQQLVSSFIPIGLGALLGAAFVFLLGSTDAKWAVAFLLFIGGSSFLLLLRVFNVTLPDVYLLLAAFLMPVIYDINFLYREEMPFFVSANGFGVSAADVFVGMLIVQWFLNWLYGNKQQDIALPKALVVIMAFLFVINLVSTIFVPYPFFALSMMWAQVKAYLVFYFIALNIRSSETLQRLTYVLVATMAIQGLVAIEQKLVGAIFTAERLGLAITLKSQVGSMIITRVSGTFGQPNALAMFLNHLMVIAMFATLVEKRLSRKLLMAGGIGLAVIAELFTASRGGWVSIAFAMFVCVVLWRRKRGTSVLVSTAVAGLVSVFGFGMLFGASQSFRDRLLLDDHGTADVRQPLMDVALNVIQNNPLTGVGLNHYAYFMAEYDRTMESIASNYPWPVHNTFLLSAAETGIISLGAFVILLGYIVWMSYKVFQRSSGITEVVAIGCLGGTITWIIHNQVDFTSLYGAYPLWLFFGVIVALDRLTKEKAEDEKPQVRL